MTARNEPGDRTLPEIDELDDTQQVDMQRLHDLEQEDFEDECESFIGFLVESRP
jgi:hypothetical protein